MAWALGNVYAIKLTAIARDGYINLGGPQCGGSIAGLNVAEARELMADLQAAITEAEKDVCDG